MIRLTLRQFRSQLIVAGVALAALAAVVLATRGHLVDVYDATIRNCPAGRSCDEALNDFMNTDRTLRAWLDILVVVTPGLLGVFWGAPLVAREFESGTFRLAWTQSVSRTRWLAAKVGIVGVGALAVAGLVSLAVTWWAHPFAMADQRRFDTFDWRDIVPIGHAAFAFALGVFVGVVFRKVLPALATTLVVFVAVRLAFTNLVRPNLLTSKQIVRVPNVDAMGFGSRDGEPMTLQPGGPRLRNAWVHSVELVNDAGHRITPTEVATACPKLVDVGPPPPGSEGVRVKADGIPNAIEECVRTVGKTFKEVTTYHAANRYWPLQWMELGIYVAAAALLVALTVGWVRRRSA